MKTATLILLILLITLVMSHKNPAPECMVSCEEFQILTEALTRSDSMRQYQLVSLLEITQMNGQLIDFLTQRVDLYHE